MSCRYGFYDELKGIRVTYPGASLNGLIIKKRRKIMNAITCALLAIYCIKMTTAIKNEEEGSFLKGLFALLSVVFAGAAIVCMFVK